MPPNIRHKADKKEAAELELYINRAWTEYYGNAYVAEAIAWSDRGYHATIFTSGITADEAYSKLLSALREMGLIPEAPTESESPT